MSSYSEEVICPFCEYDAHRECSNKAEFTPGGSKDGYMETESCMLCGYEGFFNGREDDDGIIPPDIITKPKAYALKLAKELLPIVNSEGIMDIASGFIFEEWDSTPKATKSDFLRGLLVYFFKNEDDYT